jgi:hypothetical protein
MWLPITLDQLHDLIRPSVAGMSPTERRLWELVRVPPVKWALHPWGDEGGGFWVVGLVGERVIWYNDIEDGFNISPYMMHGSIREYRCDQGGLQPVIRSLLDQVESGEFSGVFGPPRPIDKPG